MYKYLLWDIDGTVLDFLASEKYAINFLFEKFGFGKCSDEMLKKYSEINTSYWRRLERNELSKSEVLVGRFREFFKLYGIDESYAEAFNEEYQPALGECIEFVENAKETILDCKGKYVLAAVTNGTKRAQEKKLKHSGLDKIFDAIFISEDVGSEKPNKEFFDFVFEKLKITDKREALIIGDSLTSDMKGGFLAGIDTCWFNPNHKSAPSDFDITYEIDNIGKLNLLIEKSGI